LILTEQAIEDNKRLTLTEIVRNRAQGILKAPATFLNRIGIMPNTVTLFGLAGNTVAAYFLARGDMLIGGLLVLMMGPIDALDGALARLRGEPSEFGAFVDSVTDRYSELVIFGGLLFYYLTQGDWLPALLAYLAASGSVLVSYVRARAQSVGRDVKVGLLSRFERYLVVVPSLVFNIPVVGLWILAILTNITAVQRIINVRKQFRGQN
jgi:CDP-diacylglycerol--glycerol-3-phosphate 3-phosphatidyltransferase